LQNHSRLNNSQLFRCAKRYYELISIVIDREIIYVPFPIASV